ncbi:hypothetical protein J4Q44_G00386220 [Coregonus suidteri]|uniref:Uncharacterized protein n=1 Tax=Coregonus suidteri TaxID=861788 RepID=A0AAN8Q971_9TELE
MPNGESRLSSHNVSPQYRMHSYYSAASYLSQGLGMGTTATSLAAMLIRPGDSTWRSSCSTPTRPGVINIARD